MTGDRDARHQSLIELMELHGLAAVILRTPANFAWYTDGADNRVDHSSPVGVASLVVTKDGETVLCDNIEAPRMRAEQTPEIRVIEHPWFSGAGTTVRRLVGSGKYGTDLAGSEGVDLSEPLRSLRLVLDETTIARYKTVGADAVSSVHEVVKNLVPGVREREAAGMLLAACLSRGLYAPVVMAAGEERIEAFRHPVPAAEVCRRRVMLVVCAERGGLYANYTELVEFEPPDGDLQRRLRACQEILGRMQQATRAGRTLGEIFDDCIRFYAEAGFPDEWQRHHQGGLTGFATREFVAVPHSELQVKIGQAFAWNPSVRGAKAEETFVLTENGPLLIAGSH